MSDKAVLADMLSRAGVVWQLSDTGYYSGSDGDVVRVVAKEGPKNDGYSGFLVDFHFNPDGELCKVGVWE